MKRTGLVLCFGILALAMACSDDDTNGTGSDGGVTQKDGSGPTPDGYMAPKKLVRDKAKVCPGAYATTAPADGTNKSFEVEKQQRTFNIHLPDKTKFTGPRPVMVYFHGTGGSAKEIDTGRKTWKSNLLAKGFIAIGPQGEMNGTLWPEWDAMRASTDKTRLNKDVAFFDKLVDCVAGHFEVDANRIFVSGLSAGGIMSNRVLRSRSTLLAGGVVGSGVWDFTEPATTTALDSMAVMVTWGGDNDEYSGSSGGKTVPKINFAEQAAFASKAYENAAKVNQVHCKGHNVGHAWLSVVEDVMLDFLLANPKGLSKNPHWKLKTPKAGAKVTCSEDAAKYVPKVTVTCKKNTKADCLVYCQSIADCVVENGSAAPILGNELSALGFSGTNYGECAGCITNCEADAKKGGAVDDGVLACYKTESAKKKCGTGLAAAIEVSGYVNTCCLNKTKSEVCGRFCTAVMKNTVASTFFTSCTPWKK